MFAKIRQEAMERSRILQERGRDALMDDLQRVYREEEQGIAHPAPAEPGRQ